MRAQGVATFSAWSAFPCVVWIAQVDAGGLSGEILVPRGDAANACISVRMEAPKGLKVALL